MDVNIEQVLEAQVDAAQAEEYDAYSRAVELAGDAAVLRFQLQCAIDWAEGGHVPSPEQVERWRIALRKSEARS